MKKIFLQGMILGLIFILLINSICDVTFYGSEFPISSSFEVLLVNLTTLILSTVIVLLLKKLDISNKIVQITNILLIVFGIIIVIGAFFEPIREIVTFNHLYGVTGPDIKLPNILWLLILLCVTISNIYSFLPQKWILSSFFIGELVSVIIISFINLLLEEFITTFNNAIYISINLNVCIQVICGISIVIYFVYMTKKLPYGFIKYK